MALRPSAFLGLYTSMMSWGHNVFGKIILVLTLNKIKIKLWATKKENGVLTKSSEITENLF